MLGAILLRDAINVLARSTQDVRETRVVVPAHHFLLLRSLFTLSSGLTPLTLFLRGTTSSTGSGTGECGSGDSSGDSECCI